MYIKERLKEYFQVKMGGVFKGRFITKNYKNLLFTNLAHHIRGVNNTNMTRPIICVFQLK
jgi:hypothetical protein